MIKTVFINQHGEDSDFFGRVRAIADSVLPGLFEIVYYDCFELNDSPELLEQCLDDAENSALLLLDTHGGLTYFNGFRQLYERFADKKKMFIRSGIEDEVTELMEHMGMSLEQYATIEAYVKAGGAGNYVELLKYIANSFCGESLEVREPYFEQLTCLYGENGVIEDEAAYLSEIKNSGKLIVGVIIHEHHRRDDDMAIAGALFKAIAENGGAPLILVTGIDPALEARLKKYMAHADVIINTTGMSISILSSPGDGSAPREKSIFEPLNLPVLQAMQTYYTYEQWLKAIAGLDSMMLSGCVYQPEFDGQIICYPICTREQRPTAYGMKWISQPIEERVQKISRLAMNWARLRHIPPGKKRIAIILHNMPPRNDTIGCAFGLDTPASVYNMVRGLEQEGLKTEFAFSDGKDIIDRIIAGLTNDGRWLPAEEMLRRSIDTVSADQYKTWFSAFGENVRGKMTADWGEAPGEFMTVDGKILIPGILNGNVFIGLQPPRAFEEKAEECYHSTDIVCPHQYIAFYKWVEHIFKADVIVHVGTHGTIEWLPGKEIGLSQDCYPDIAIGCLPHLYVYNISITGEGMQAKRRTSAALVGHLIPSMKESGVYGELAEMDELLAAYNHAKQATPARLPDFHKQIWELAESLKLNIDLGTTEMPDDFEMPAFIEKLHLWIERIKASEVRDGLHLLGQAPEGERMINLLRLLVRVRNSEVPSLREALCAERGLDAHELMSHPEALAGDGRTNAMILDDIDDKGHQLMEMLASSDYSPGELHMGNEIDSLCRYICETLYPALKQTTDEMAFFLKGVRGEFISPGPSGNPSRGNAQILPTGRNFYAIDPGAIPTRSAWRMGQTLAQQLVDAELLEKGQYPESVAIVVYAGETMKTCGDDLAEMLSLLGVQPVWLGNTDRVIGLDVIPLETLGRPRIDVTLRISGLFRDTFPNLIERIEDAVNLVAALDEPDEMNYLRKHVNEEIADMVSSGITGDDAYVRASARVFGCPPGTYGAGVDTLIYSKKWASQEDLGNIFMTWSGHAYGRHVHGAAWRDQFARRLSKTTVTVKNESSVEIDMLDSDDFFNYHGGLIAATQTASGEKPRSYSTNTADSDHVETLELNAETARIMRARINNPKWLEGLEKHGYKGAQEISAMVDIIFGWDATSENIENWMYDEITKNFVLNEETRQWINEVNPWAMHAMSERLLEASQRGMWEASDEMLQQLRDVYMEVEGGIEENL
jgi:cobaltochelatase CobN